MIYQKVPIPVMPQSPRFRRAEANTDDISLFHVRPWSSASPLVMTAAPKPSVTEKKDKVLTFVDNLLSVSVLCPIQKVRIGTQSRNYGNSPTKDPHGPFNPGFEPTTYRYKSNTLPTELLGLPLCTK